MTIINLTFLQVYVQSHDPLPDTGFDPDINRRRPLNPDRPLPQKRTIRGIDRSGFAVGKRKYARFIMIIQYFLPMVLTLFLINFFIIR